MTSDWLHAFDLVLAPTVSRGPHAAAMGRYVSTEPAVYTASVADVTEPGQCLAARATTCRWGRYTAVRRLLPHRQRRMIGAWCFVDHFGPGRRHRPARDAGPAAPAHRPADRDLAGRRRDPAPRQPRQRRSDPARAAQPDDLRHGIAHSEDSPPEHPPLLHGAAAVGRAARAPPGTAPPGSSTTPTCRSSTSPGVTRHRGGRRARRRAVAGRGAHARCVGARGHVCAGARRAGCRSTRPSSTGCWSIAGAARGRRRRR